MLVPNSLLAYMWYGCANPAIRPRNLAYPLSELFVLAHRVEAEQQ